MQLQPLEREKQHTPYAHGRRAVKGAVVHSTTEVSEHHPQLPKYESDAQAQPYLQKIAQVHGNTIYLLTLAFDYFSICTGLFPRAATLSCSLKATETAAS